VTVQGSAGRGTQGQRTNGTYRLSRKLQGIIPTRDYCCTEDGTSRVKLRGERVVRTLHRGTETRVQPRCTAWLPLRTPGVESSMSATGVLCSVQEISCSRWA
jgi:hypothetical protein